MKLINSVNYKIITFYFLFILNISNSNAQRCYAYNSVLKARYYTSNCEKRTFSWKGTIKDGYVNGKGKLTMFENSKIIYTMETKDGSVVDGKLNGNAKINFTNGTIYEGSFKDGKYDGQGYLKYSGGNKFEGLFKNDLVFEGKLTRTDGIIMEGTFADYQEYLTLITGKLITSESNLVKTYYYTDGFSDESDAVLKSTDFCKRTSIDGKCKIKCPVGRQYWDSPTFQVDASNYSFSWDGEIVDGFANGFGTITYYNDNAVLKKIVGNMVKGHFFGFVKMYTESDKLYYAGYVKCGAMHGWGTYYADDYQQYGEYFYNWNSGSQYIYFANGDTLLGVYDYASTTLSGTRKYKNGNYFNGVYNHVNEPYTGEMYNKKRELIDVYKLGVRKQSYEEKENTKLKVWDYIVKDKSSYSSDLTTVAIDLIRGEEKTATINVSIFYNTQPTNIFINYKQDGLWGNKNDGSTYVNSSESTDDAIKRLIKQYLRNKYSAVNFRF